MSFTLLELQAADRPEAGAKARNLALVLAANPSGFAVPPGVVVGPEFDPARHLDRLCGFLRTLGEGPFAVRSSGLAEDGFAESLAGRYLSLLDVPTAEVPRAIERVRASIEAEGDSGAVLIQPMIPSRLAGVLFTRSPDNPAVALCEYVDGAAEGVVSGRVAPRLATCGRYSGAIAASLNRDDRRVLEDVFLMGATLEERWQAPQDVEWAWDVGRRQVCLLQSRPITADAGGRAVAAEQERACCLAQAADPGCRGGALFDRRVLRGVVDTPTRMTRSLLQRVYAPSGSLGRAFAVLGLPLREARRSYAVSLFGELYADRSIERRLFGASLTMWWATRKLRRRFARDPSGFVQSLIAQGAAAARSQPSLPADNEVRACAGFVAALAKHFVEAAYPPAYAATLAAQLCGEGGAEPHVPGASATGRLLRDLSRLHHTGRVDEFLDAWGHRGVDDYELARPRFDEDPESARQFAGRFAALPWDDPRADDRGLVGLKELAKDRAVRLLGGVRRALLQLESALGLPAGEIFLLDLDDVEAVAAGAVSPLEVLERIARNAAEERAWRAIDLGDEPTLEDVERLGSRSVEGGRALVAQMVGAPRPFRGVIRRVTAETAGQERGSDPEVRVALALEPWLVGHYPASAGVIVDVGGRLSHAAIVAREMGHPVAVLPGASSTMRDGDEVEVSATGEVLVRPHPQRPAATPVSGTR